MISPRAELMVGAFAILVIAALGVVTFKIGDFRFGEEEGYRVYAYFDDAAGLYEKAPVKIAGVDAGVLEKIELEDGRAKVTLLMRPGVKIYPDASAYIRASGLLGDKYIEVKVGTVQAVCCMDGATISETYEIVDVDEVMKNISNVSMNLLEFVAGLNDPELKNSLVNTIRNIDKITTDLQHMVSENRDSLGNAIRRIESLAEALDGLTGDNRGALTNTIHNLEALSASLRSDAPTMINTITLAAGDVRELAGEGRGEISRIATRADSALASIDSIAGKIDRGEGTIGKLVNDEELYTQAGNAVRGLSNVLTATERFTTEIEFRSEYLSKEADTKGTANIIIKPREDKYYIFGVVTDPLGHRTVKTRTRDGVRSVEETVEERLEFNAQFARRFKDTALRIGMIESAFGVGMDQYFFDDRMRVSMDMWDFSEEEAEADHPHFRLGLDYRVVRHMFFATGVDNVLNDDRFGSYVGAGFRFEDRDLKYLFGAAGSVPGL